MSLFFFREQEAKIKGEYSDLKGKAPKDIKRFKMLKRIQQYERFVENCERYKEFEKSKRDKKLVDRRYSMVDPVNQRPVEKIVKRSKSLLPFPQDREYKEAKQKDRYSLPELPECDQNFTLDEKILIWQCCGEAQQKKGWMKSSSLAALVEETEEEDLISVRSKRRSKSIDSRVTCTFG